MRQAIRTATSILIILNLALSIAGIALVLWSPASGEWEILAGVAGIAACIAATASDRWFTENSLVYPIAAGVLLASFAVNIFLFGGTLLFLAALVLAAVIGG